MNSIPSISEIGEAAIAAGCESITAPQIVQIWQQLHEVPDNLGYSHNARLELAIGAAQTIHNKNIAMLNAAAVAEIERPEGFDGIEPGEWCITGGHVTRWWDREIDTHAINGTVRIHITDRIEGGRIVRSGPIVEVSAEGQFTRDDLLSFTDALMSAARELAELEGATL